MREGGRTLQANSRACSGNNAAHVIYLRDDRLAVIVLSNLNIAGVTREIARGILSLALGETPDVSAPVARSLPSDSASALAGRYAFGDDFYVPGGTLDIVERDGVLLDGRRASVRPRAPRPAASPPATAEAP